MYVHTPSYSSHNRSITASYMYIYYSSHNRSIIASYIYIMVHSSSLTAPNIAKVHVVMRQLVSCTSATRLIAANVLHVHFFTLRWVESLNECQCQLLTGFVLKDVNQLVHTMYAFSIYANTRNRRCAVCIIVPLICAVTIFGTWRCIQSKAYIRTISSVERNQFF